MNDLLARLRQRSQNPAIPAWSVTGTASIARKTFDVGNGDSSELHTAGYDFNDAVIPVGTSYWVKLAEKALPVVG